jgi:GR25 family glycosyltransferase involved in LPS biosynthesis
MFNESEKFVINLDRRHDRLASVMIEFDKFNLIVNRWEAIDANHLIVPNDSKKNKEFNAKGILACMLSHKSLIQYAKNNGYKYLTVFEDDIYLCSDFWKRIEYIDNYDFDLFMLGGHFDTFGKDVIPIDKFVFQCNQVSGTYGYIMKNTVFDFVIENMNYNYGADEFFGDRIQKKFDVKTFIPFIVGHIDGEYSDVTNRNEAYNTGKNFKDNIWNF